MAPPWGFRNHKVAGCLWAARRAATHAAGFVAVVLILRLLGLSGGPADLQQAAPQARLLAKNLTGLAPPRRRLLRDKHKTAVEIAEEHYKEYCLPLIHDAEAHGIDIFPPEKAAACWGACLEVLPIHLLNGWVGQTQARLQELLQLPRRAAAAARERIAHLLPSWALSIRLPGFLSPLATNYFLTIVPILAVVLMERYVDDDPEGWACLMPVIYLTIAICALVKIWLYIVGGLCVLAACLARDTGAISQAAPWSWMAAVSSLQLPYMPLSFSLIIELVILPSLLINGALNFAIPSLRKENAGQCEYLLAFNAVITACELAVMLFIWAVEFVVLLIMFFFQSGAHATEWVCGKSAVGASFGWLPDGFCWQAGGAYAAASIVHGLWQGFRQPPARIVKPKDDNGCFTDAVCSMWALRVKFLGLFSDITLDFSQILLFLQRSQLYFATFNASGILLQMLLFVISLLRGHLPDMSLSSVVLQSDTVVLMRTSAAAGFVLQEMHEKLYRESFGETYISMMVAVFAMYTVPMHQTSDVFFFMFSIALSLSSVKSGVAEALEYVEAESEKELVEGFRISVIPANHYYFRTELSKRRNLRQVAAVRVSEAMVPILTAAVCCKCSNAKVTFMTASVTAVLVQGSVLVTRLDMESVRAALLGLRPSTEETKWCVVVCLVFTLIFIVELFVGLTVALVVCPFALFLLYAFPITVLGKQSDNTDTTASIQQAAYDFAYDFVGVLYSKFWFVLILWGLLGLSLIGPKWSPFDFGAFLHRAVEEIGNGLFEGKAASLQAAVQLCLICFALLNAVVMCAATDTLQGNINAWKTKDIERASYMKEQCETLRTCAAEIERRMMKLRVIDEEWADNPVGVRHPANEEKLLVQLAAARLARGMYGTHVASNDEYNKAVQAAQYLKALLLSIEGEDKRGERFLSPRALAEDLRSLAEHCKPPLDGIQAVLNQSADWLENVCTLEVEQEGFLLVTTEDGHTLAEKLTQAAEADFHKLRSQRLEDATRFVSDACSLADGVDSKALQETIGKDIQEVEKNIKNAQVTWR